MTKVVVCNRYVYPDHSATSQLVADLAFALAVRGVDVELVGSRQAYEDADAAFARFERVRGVTIRRVGGTRFGRGSIAGRAVDYLTFFLGAAVTLLRHVNRGDVVVLKTDPPLQSVVLGPIARWRGAKVVNWLQDVFPEVAEVLLEHEQGPFAALLRRLRDRSLRRADVNVVLGSRMAERVRSIALAAPTVIPNWADDEHVRPLARADNALRREWGLGDRFVVGYSGNLGRAHDWKTMLDAATALKAREDIVFLCVGSGYGMDSLRTAAQARGLSNVRFEPYQPRERLAESLTVPDVHWMSLRPRLEGLIVPSKLYGAMAAGRPVVFVGDPDGEVARVLKRYDCGMTLREGDGKGFATAVEWLAGDSSRGEAMGARARAGLEAEFSKTASIGKWVDTLRGLGADDRVGEGSVGAKAPPTGAG